MEQPVEPLVFLASRTKPPRRAATRDFYQTISPSSMYYLYMIMYSEIIMAFKYLANKDYQ